MTASPTFSKMCDAYLQTARAKGKAPNTRKEEKRKIKKVLKPRWGDRKVITVTRKDVMQLLDEMGQKTPVQTNRMLVLIRIIFKEGRLRGYVEHDPCLDITPPNDEVSRSRFLSEEEIKKAWEVFNSMTPRMGDVLRLLMITAQRKGELCSMRWSDIDLEQGWWTIPAGVTKNKKEHRVPLTEMALEILKKREKVGNSQWVFPAKTGATGHVK